MLIMVMIMMMMIMLIEDTHFDPETIMSYIQYLIFTQWLSEAGIICTIKTLDRLNKLPNYLINKCWNWYLTLVSLIILYFYLLWNPP